MSSDTPNFLKKLSVPRPSTGHLAALSQPDRPIAVFSDFDGTIFLQDTGHVLFDKFGCGKEKREELDRSIGKSKTFREASEELWNSLDVTLDEAEAELKKHLVIDPDFIHFFDYLQEHNVKFTVISAGMKPLLRTALDAFVGPERSAKIDIISNNGTVTEDGKWYIHWLHDSPLGIDKSLAIKDWLREQAAGALPEPRVVFIGDGVSDLAAANQADILFARQGLALEDYCIQHMIPYIPYMRFKEALQDIKYLIADNRYHDESAAKRYNMARIQNVTGGLTPLSSEPISPRAEFGFAPNSSSEEDDEEEEDYDGNYYENEDDEWEQEDPVPLVPPSRPHTPPYEPTYFSKPPLVRDFSTGNTHKTPK